MGKAFFVLLYAACFSCVAFAGQMYRCGNSFQQAPCDGDKSGAMTVQDAMVGAEGSSARAGTRQRVLTNKEEKHGSGHAKRLPRKAKATSKASADCPTALEIRNSKVGANSITLSGQERAKRLKAIEKMERCGKSW